ncbi:hypothetical protein D3C78_1558730 [compost metagenome]
MLAADEPGQLVAMLLHQRLEAKHHPRPYQRRSLGPVGEGLLGDGDGLGALGGGAEHHLSLLLAGGRIEDGAEALAVALFRLTADEVANPVCHISSLMGNSSQSCVAS